MSEKRSPFEVLLVIVAIAFSLLGFQLINTLYIQSGSINWMMVLAIFAWLTLLLLFVILGFISENSRKLLDEIKKQNQMLESEHHEAKKKKAKMLF